MEGEPRELSDFKFRENALLSEFKISVKSPFCFLNTERQKEREGSGIFWSYLSLKKRISPLRVLTASKDKAGSHAAGVPGSEGTDSVGATGSSGDTGGDPEGNRCGEATRGTVTLSST